MTISVQKFMAIHSIILGYWSKVVVLNEGVQFCKHIDYCGSVCYILLRLHLPTMSSVRKLRPSMVW